MVYWETSAKDGKNVEEVFTYIGQILFDTYKDENSLVGNSLFMNKDNNQRFFMYESSIPYEENENPFTKTKEDDDFDEKMIQKYNLKYDCDINF